jgi:hypothetical protein
MSVKDTYKGWRTTVLGLVIQLLVAYVWYMGIQPIEIWSVVLFLAGFGLWLMPDTVINTIKHHIKRDESTTK